MRPKAKIYDPREFDHLITINTLTVTPNEYNEPIRSLTQFAQVWAKIVYGAGKEFYAGNAGQKGSKVAQSTVMFTFRYLEGLDEKMVIVDGTDVYNITDISILNRNQYHQVVAHSDAE